MNRRPVTRLEAFLHALAAVVLRPPKGRHHQPTTRTPAGEDTTPIRAIRAANPYPRSFDEHRPEQRRGGDPRWVTAL